MLSRALHNSARQLTGGSMGVMSAADKQRIVGSYATVLDRSSNQALGIAEFARDFMNGSLGKGPDASVLRRTELFHMDSVVCGLSALALRTNAPTVLRDEALEEYLNEKGATVFGDSRRVSPEKAICANASAVREWDSNGTVFGYNEKLGAGHTAGEFGHNDFYPVAIAACQMKGLSGDVALKAMVLSDEIRGRLAEVFSLKTYKIDHVVHGAIASAAVYGTLMGATPKQIESAIGMVVAHYIPWRAIRAGKQLSDSKGASAALSTEAAIMAVHRSMRGFLGPQDITNNPEAIFRYFTGEETSPFDLALSHSGDDFAIMGMHFKLGLYEHQSAGTLQGVIDVIAKDPSIVSSVDAVSNIKIVAYEPAFGIIGDPAKRSPTTRQSADHSMVFIVARKLLKAISLGPETVKDVFNREGSDGLWKKLILTPYDYSQEAINDPATRKLMDRIEFEHGGEKFDSKYPEGIPSQVVISTSDGKKHDSGFVMFPSGHSKNTTADLEGILRNKFDVLGRIAVGEANVESLRMKLSDLASKSPDDLQAIYNVPIQYGNPVD